MHSKNDIQQAVETLRKGGFIGLPTETVYGLAADACNDDAVTEVFSVKGRPSHNPLIVHVSGLDMASRYADVTPLAERLANEYWPGALTLVMPLKVEAAVSDKVTVGGATIALRAPAHPIAREVIAAFDGGLAAPSANRSGRISPTTRQHVVDEFGDAVPFVLEGGACKCGLESTVVDVTGDTPITLRTGIMNLSHWERPMSQSELGEGPLSKSNVSASPSGRDNSIRSPGQLTAHYSPSKPVRLNATSPVEGEALLGFGNISAEHAVLSQNLSKQSDLAEAAHNLYAMLRILDVSTAVSIAVAPIPEEGIGVAINDRLRRAAAAHTS